MVHNGRDVTRRTGRRLQRTTIVGEDVEFGFVRRHIRFVILQQLLQHRIQNRLQVRLIQIQEEDGLFYEVLNVIRSSDVASEVLDGNALK